MFFVKIKWLLPSGRFFGIMQKEGHRHYSEKGGHKERSDFWKEVDRVARDLGRFFNYNPRFQTIPIEQAYIIRRNMFRDPRDGRR